jgi:hypothetical protein
VKRKNQPLELARASNLCPSAVISFYYNKKELYDMWNYPPSHIWNCDKSGVQARRNEEEDIVLAKVGSKSVHTIESD